MSIISEYLSVIDVLALLALAVMAIEAFVRSRTIWMAVLSVVVIAWVAARLFHFT